uniref:Uncharacterized protein n=1 Tax=Glossina austeni TaxID=7395 RepID=A0A1A9UXJ7_GLOAU
MKTTGTAFHNLDIKNLESYLLMPRWASNGFAGFEVVEHTPLKLIEVVAQKKVNNSELADARDILSPLSRRRNRSSLSSQLGILGDERKNGSLARIKERNAIPSDNFDILSYLDCGSDPEI